MTHREPTATSAESKANSVADLAPVVREYIDRPGFDASSFLSGLDLAYAIAQVGTRLLPQGFRTEQYCHYLDTIRDTAALVRLERDLTH